MVFFFFLLPFGAFVFVTEAAMDGWGIWRTILATGWVVWRMVGMMVGRSGMEWLAGVPVWDMFDEERSVSVKAGCWGGCGELMERWLLFGDGVGKVRCAAVAACLARRTLGPVLVLHHPCPWR